MSPGSRLSKDFCCALITDVPLLCTHNAVGEGNFPSAKNSGRFYLHVPLNNGYVNQSSSTEARFHWSESPVHSSSFNPDQTRSDCGVQLHVLPSAHNEHRAPLFVCQVVKQRQQTSTQKVKQTHGARLKSPIIHAGSRPVNSAVPVQKNKIHFMLKPCIRRAVIGGAP